MKTKTIFVTITFFVTIAIAASAAIACGDPVHDNAVDGLGGEAPGVRKGPLHRAGQPCLLCHDGVLGNPPEFSVAGTVYLSQNGTLAAEGAIVALATPDGKTFKATTNAAGNFYITPNEFTPSYPMKVAVTFGKTKVEMKSHVGRDGSCATCHTDPSSSESSGHIYIATGDGGGL